MISFSSRRAIWQLRAKVSQRGFNLIEIALVLVIVGLVLGGGIAALGPLLENKKVSDTQERIKQASDAILMYAIVNKRIPCPASATSNGIEVMLNASGKCANFDNGFVPARTLGLMEQGPNGLVQDAWSYGLRYGVSQTTITSVGGGGGLACPSSVPCYPLTKANGFNDAGTTVLRELQVCASSTGISTNITPPTCGTAARLAEVGFVVWSTARNGAKSLAPTPVGDGPDENANLNNDRVYVFHSRTDAGPPVPPNGAFDDLFRWTSVTAIRIEINKAL